MRKKILPFILVVIGFLLQSTVCHKIALSGIIPNLLVIIVAAYGIMRGSREGLWIGFFCGVIEDLFFGYYLGMYALIYMLVGYLSGLFQSLFYPDDIKLPLLIIGAGDLVSNFAVYFICIFKGSFDHFGYYLKSIILPEFVYTVVVSVFVYLLLLHLENVLDEQIKKGAQKI